MQQGHMLCCLPEKVPILGLTKSVVISEWEKKNSAKDFTYTDSVTSTSEPD